MLGIYTQKQISICNSHINLIKTVHETNNYNYKCYIATKLIRFHLAINLQVFEPMTRNLIQHLIHTNS